MKHILGTKQEMTQYFTETGECIPATLVEAGPVTVTQVRTPERDGYAAVQVGFQETNEKALTQAEQGHLAQTAPFQFLREFRVDDPTQYNVGDRIDLSVFAEGEEVIVSGTTKAKGFQGTVKRHNFKGQPSSHGIKHAEREPGAIGATGPQRVFKNTRMAGRMGGNRVTVKNLPILAVRPEENALLLAGAVPGARGTLLEIRTAATATEAAT